MSLSALRHAWLKFALLAGLGVSAALPARAANDLILRIEGTAGIAVPGESTITNHVGEIDALSFSWGVARNGTATGSSVNAQQLTLTKRLDKASPPLMLAVFQGTHFQRVKLFVRTQGANPLDYFVITMQDVVVMSCQPSGSADGTILESISLSMGTIVFDYQPLNPDGTANGAKVTAGWNITTNQKI